MPTLLVLAMLGAAVGYAAGAYMRLRISLPAAMASGVIGALIGGIGLRLQLGPFGALLGAVLGAALIVALAQSMTRD